MFVAVTSAYVQPSNIASCQITFGNPLPLGGRPPQCLILLEDHPPSRRRLPLSDCRHEQPANQATRCCHPRQDFWHQRSRSQHESTNQQQPSEQRWLNEHEDRAQQRKQPSKACGEIPDWQRLNQGRRSHCGDCRS